MKHTYMYNAKVLRVVDGDTVDAEVDLGFGLTMTQRFRIDDLDTPETWRPKSEAERIHGEQATLRAKELLLDKKLIFITSKVPGIYGRFGATIFLEDGNNFKEVMINEGFQKRKDYS